jgi:hypothetical protein
VKVSAQLRERKPGGATAEAMRIIWPMLSRVVLFEKLLKGPMMLIKEFQDLKREVMRLREELERLKEELLTARIEELRQTVH